MNNEDKVILERYKRNGYTVRYNGRKYYWSGAKGKVPSKLPVPREVYDYLAMDTNCFKKGELVLSKSTPKDVKEELEINLYDKETVDANTLTREEVETLLKGTIPAMKKRLDQVTSFTTKKFVLDVAKEIKISNANKQKYLKDWYGTEIPLEDLFDFEDDK